MKLPILFFSLISSLIILPSFFPAQAIVCLNGQPPAAGKPCEPLKAEETILGTGPTGAVELLETIGDWIFTIFLAIAVIFIVIAAFNYLTSAGSDEKVTKAHKMLLYAVIGLAVAFLSYGIVTVIGKLVKLPTATTTTGGTP